MKAFYTLLTVTGFLFLGSLDLKSQDYRQLFTDKAYKRIQNHMDATVDIELRRNKSTVSSAEAIRMIRERLDVFAPVSWEKMHSGSTEENSARYLILKATNANDEALRIFIHLKEVDGQKKISSIRFRRAL